MCTNYPGIYYLGMSPYEPFADEKKKTETLPSSALNTHVHMIAKLVISHCGQDENDCKCTKLICEVCKTTGFFLFIIK